MGTRVPIRIYRLVRRVEGAEPSPTESRYIQNKTTDDIVTLHDGYLYINLSPDDIPGFDPSYAGIKFVDFVSDLGLYTVKIGTTDVLFIQGAEISKINQLGYSTETTGGGIPSVFEFYVNPEHVTPTYRKLLTEIRTRGGWEVQHWGDALTELKITGRSGGMHKVDERDSSAGGIGKSLKKGESVMVSTAWKRLAQLRKLYEADHSIKNREADVLVGINYYDKFYVGYFTDFTGPEADKDSPYVINYSFTLRIQTETAGQLVGAI